MFAGRAECSVPLLKGMESLSKTRIATTWFNRRSNPFDSIELETGPVSLLKKGGLIACHERLSVVDDAFDLLQQGDGVISSTQLQQRFPERLLCDVSCRNPDKAVPIHDENPTQEAVWGNLRYSCSCTIRTARSTKLGGVIAGSGHGLHPLSE